jgi:hypothetical protein
MSFVFSHHSFNITIDDEYGKKITNWVILNLKMMQPQHPFFIIFATQNANLIKIIHERITWQQHPYIPNIASIPCQGLT